MRFRIVIDKDGTVHSVYNDALARMGLGDMKVSRASNVEFDNELQLWVARDLQGHIMTQGTRREEVLKTEHALVEDELVRTL